MDNLTQKNIEQIVDKLSRKQFRRQKKTWSRNNLNEQALRMIFGGAKSDNNDAFAKWTRA